MVWINLNKFLKRFEGFKPPKEYVQSSAAEIVADCLDININYKNITCRGGVLYIRDNNPLIKNQIFCGKEKLLSEFKKKMGSRAPQEIRFGWF